MIFLFVFLGAVAASIRLNNILLAEAARLCLFTSITIIAVYTAVLVKLLPGQITGTVLSLTNYLSYLFVFIAALVITKIRWSLPMDSNLFSPVRKLVTISLKIIIAGGFLRVTIGKSLHLHEMENFFLASGLPVWLNYFVMMAELLGVSGILLNGKLKTGVLAAAGLLILMSGAIIVHLHNGDPFSDSADAAFMLICLVLYLLSFASIRFLNTPK